MIFDKKSSFNLIYDMFQNKLKILKNYFNNNLIKKFIRLKYLFIILYIFFARRFNEEFHFYVNYRVFNVIIIKN